MPKTMCRVLIAVSALLMALATGLGAWASHGLGSLDEAGRHAFETGVNYQFVHALGVLAIAIHARRNQAGRAFGLAAAVLLAGIVLFCGGVYSSSLAGPEWIAGLAPTGGIGLIVGWLLVGFAALRDQSSAS
jgi:uncharacterized membrane protein YgdD (TMEM256/DUF423 family)